MANDSFKVKKGLNIEPNTTPNLSTDGDIGFNSTDSNLEVYTGGSVKKVITNSQTQTLTNKTLTSPVINSPTGLVKADVGLDNVDNTSDATKNAATATLTNKTIDAANNTLVGVMSNPMTTGGDIVYGGASGTPTRLANGTNGQYLKSNGGTAAPSWQSFTAPTIQTFTSGSGTYTTPANVRYIKVRMVGGGGGGAGSGTANGSAAGAGGNTTFGTSLLVANGGQAGARIQSNLTGGTASLGTGPIGFAWTGGSGGNSQYVPTGGFEGAGGTGGGTMFGPGGAGGAAGSIGRAAAANTGGGGGGGGGANAVTLYTGGGGSGGGYLDAIINAPSATYAYAVGAGGTAGGAGTSGFAAGAGAAGVIIVEEYY
jgi:hypothetical protein